jgi:hypothetical protein
MAEQSFGGPYVQVAAICMTPLVEQQGYLSVIRMQDRIQLAGPGDQMKPQPLHNLSLVISLKAGEMRGKGTIKITPHSPSGKDMPSAEVPALFEGDERGCVIATPLAVVAEEEGLYWFDVSLEGALLTRIPLRVMYQKMPGFPGMPFQAPNND